MVDPLLFVTNFFFRVRFISFLQESCVACLHHGKDLGRSYLEGEKAIFILAFEGANSTNYLSIYLSEKVDFGWKFLKSVVNPYDDNPEAIIEECLEELGVDIYDINHVFSRIFYDPSLKLALPDLFDEVTILVDGTEACKEEILKAGKYLSMIYAKNGNYDCYVPHVLEQKFKLHVGNQIIPLPIQFKPFPYNLSVKITLEENVNNLDVSFVENVVFFANVCGFFSCFACRVLFHQISFLFEVYRTQKKKEILFLHCTPILLIKFHFPLN